MLRGKARCASQGEALRVEHAIKQLSRDDKFALFAKQHRLRAFVRKHLQRSARSTTKDA